MGIVGEYGLCVFGTWYVTFVDDLICFWDYVHQFVCNFGALSVTKLPRSDRTDVYFVMICNNFFVCESF